jgi:hypothetical protein
MVIKDTLASDQFDNGFPAYGSDRCRNSIVWG